MNNSESILSIFGLLIVCFLVGCSEQSDSRYKVAEFNEESKTGVKTTLYENGKVASIVKFINGKKHGLNRSYYRNGNLKAIVNYEMGTKQGEAKYYYETGELYRLSSYYDGELDGIRKKYRQNGQLMAEIPYQYGWPGIGLKEYTTKNKLKTEYPKLRFQKTFYDSNDRLKSIKLYFEPHQEDAEFFIGDLVNNQYLHRRLFSVPVDNGIGILRIPDLPMNDNRKVLKIIGKLQTRLKNPYIISIEVDLE